LLERQQLKRSDAVWAHGAESLILSPEQLVRDAASQELTSGRARRLARSVSHPLLVCGSIAWRWTRVYFGNGGNQNGTITKQ
jgi:hypothetical protein